MASAFGTLHRREVPVTCINRISLAHLDLNESKIIGLPFIQGGFMVTINKVIAFISKGDFKCSLPPLEKFDKQCLGVALSAVM